MLGEQIKENNRKLPFSRDAHNQFLESVADAAIIGPTEETMPHVETTRDIIEHYNKHHIKGFDDNGFFIFQGVKVYEVGKKDEVRAKETNPNLGDALSGGVIGAVKL